jgi:hypothetical protein
MLALWQASAGLSDIGVYVFLAALQIEGEVKIGCFGVHRAEAMLLTLDVFLHYSWHGIR